MDKEIQTALCQIFLESFNDPEQRQDLSFAELCEGVENLFYAGMNDKIPYILGYMQMYVQESSI